MDLAIWGGNSGGTKVSVGADFWVGILFPAF